MDILKRDLILELGYSGPMGQIEELLSIEKLSSTRKERIDLRKRHLVERLLSERMVAPCGRPECEAAAAKLLTSVPRLIRGVPATGRACRFCQGSAISLAVEEMVAASVGADWSKLCIVGGSPASRQRLLAEVKGRIVLRLIDGTARRSGAQARGDLLWADHSVVWGSTELAHRVSLLYSRHPRCSSIARRGIVELARHVAAAARSAVGPH